MDWHPIHGGCKNMVVLSFFKQGSVLVKWAPWLNKVNFELKPSGRSSQSLSWCPWLELVCPWMRCQSIARLPFSISLVFPDDLLLPIYTLWWSFQESKCTNIRLPFLACFCTWSFLYWTCFCYFSTDTRMCWIIRMGNYHQNVLQILTG